MSRPRAVLLLAAALAAAGCSHMHIEHDAFVWTGTVAPGKWVHIRNLTGSITVEATSGTQIDIRATKRWQRDGNSVRFVQNTTGDGIVVCTLLDSRGRCTPEDYAAQGRRGFLSSVFHKRSDATVDYVVRVPAGVNIDLSTVTGPVKVAGTSGDVRAQTVNGEIAIAAREGSLKLNTVNGSVTAVVDSLTPAGDISIRSVNGSVTAVLPPRFDGSVSFETINGKITSGFPVTATGPVSPRRMFGTVGGGGAGRVELSTVNGSVSLIKHS